MASHSGCRRAESPDTANFASFLCFLLVRLLEKSGGSIKPLEGRDSSQPKFDLLTDNGNWRLIFTTGDVKTQKKLGGKISYVPIKAVQVCLSLYVCVLWWCRSVCAAGSPCSSVEDSIKKNDTRQSCEGDSHRCSNAGTVTLLYTAYARLLCKGHNGISRCVSMSTDIFHPHGVFFPPADRYSTRTTPSRTVSTWGPSPSSSSLAPSHGRRRTLA